MLTYYSYNTHLKLSPPIYQCVAEFNLGGFVRSIKVKLRIFDFKGFFKKICFRHCILFTVKIELCVGGVRCWKEPKLLSCD
ncbi:hypothetical protein HanRHA438_Chr06g0277631 [Helianthus annuus]|nr:hypothetical protein HanIR_Chr06g0288701 [Helianthus annuus]KAJ0912730.1 hypothetical protein HanRHA438_Chr06g0277631 [Helianthus annuus]